MRPWLMAMLLVGLLWLPVAAPEEEGSGPPAMEDFEDAVAALQTALDEYSRVMDEVRRTMEQVHGTTTAAALDDTAVVQVGLSAKTLRQLTGMYWEMQNIGYPNRLRTVQLFAYTQQRRQLDCRLAQAPPAEREAIRRELAAVSQKLEILQRSAPAD
ncbi:MAG: hypothetical protein JXQ27_15645 [Acidobacteria bacterium]|nr:hypothetical protein [Acidobacteriota bacterium]